MIPVTEALEKKVLVSMGPLGTNLHERGMLELGANTSLWCLKHEEEYASFLREWTDIGCDIVFANTSALNPLLLAEEQGALEAVRSNARMIEIARKAAAGSAYVAADLVSMTLSTGRFLPPLGDLDPDRLYNSYRTQAEAFRDAGADLAWLVTMADLVEMDIALRAVKEAGDLPVLVSFAFDRGAKGFRTMMGVEAKEAAVRAEETGAAAVGANCGSIGLNETTELVRICKGSCNLPVIAVPGAGMPRLEGGKTVYPIGPEEMGREAVEWSKAGARIVSGCCGSTVEHIAAMIRYLQEGIE